MQNTETEFQPAETMPRKFGKLRLEWLDAARGIALLTMASFHFTWDLEYFGYVQPGTANSMPMRIYAHSIASSFLFLVGFSLYLAHGKSIKWPSFWKRFARIVLAAGLVTAATFAVMREEFIYFGILHQIALASLIGLLFIRIPPILTLVVAAGAIATPHYLRNSFFDTPILYWVGLSDFVRPSNDYVPLLPWIGASLSGVAIAKLMRGFDKLHWLSAGRNAVDNRVFKLFSTGGRHSLAIYLIHQPLLIGLLWCYAQVLPPASPDPALSYMNSCQRACVADRNESFCKTFCGCTLSELRNKSLFVALNKGELNVNHDDRVSDISRQCTIAAMEQDQKP